MATKQKQVEKQESICKGQFNILTSLAIENRSKSVALMQDIASLVVSSILYYRKIIPPEMFTEKKCGNQRVKILKRGTNDNNMANNFCGMLYTVHETIDGGFLKKFIITFLENDQPVEKHGLYFEHTGETYKTVMIDQFFSKSKIHLKHQINKLRDSIFETISRFIHTLINVEYIIEKPSVAVEIIFYDEKKPKDFVPKFFNDYDENNEKVRLATQPINFGEIATPFHGLKLKSQFRTGIHEEVMLNIRGINTSQELENEPEIKKTHENSETTLTSQSESVIMNLVELAGVITSDESESNNNNNMYLDPAASNGLVVSDSFTEIEKQKVGVIPSTEEEEEERIEIETIDLTEDMELDYADYIKEEENGFRCPCQIYNNEWLALKCANCNMYQHSYCFNILKEDHIPVMHICDICAARNSQFQCTVPELVTMDKDAKTNRCILRLVLGITYFTGKKVSKEYLTTKFQLNSDYADELTKRLDQSSIISRTGGSVNRRMFERNFIPAIFKDYSSSEVLPRSPFVIPAKRARTL